MKKKKGDGEGTDKRRAFARSSYWVRGLGIGNGKPPKKGTPCPTARPPAETGATRAGATVGGLHYVTPRARNHWVIPLVLAGADALRVFARLISSRSAAILTSSCLARCALYSTIRVRRVSTSSLFSSTGCENW